jgi:hypothetical protein
LRDTTANLADRTAMTMMEGDILLAWTDTRNGSEDIFTSLLFDPDGESISGAGKINSRAGAYIPNPALSGKAEFGFEARYRTRGLLPSGNAEFRFEAGKTKLRFRSKSYEWLFVSGNTAQLKGSGTLNGEEDYVFLITILDGKRIGRDRFRIKIADKASGALVYDSAPGAPDDNAFLQLINEGRIEIRD